MAKLKIVIAGAPVLREVAQPVERIDKKLQRLLRDMTETMYAADGVGLAAPQVLRICGMRIHRQNRSTHAAFRKWSAGYLHSA